MSKSLLKKLSKAVSCSFVRVCSHLLKKSLMKNFIFCAVHSMDCSRKHLKVQSFFFFGLTWQGTTVCLLYSKAWIRINIRQLLNLAIFSYEGLGGRNIFCFYSIMLLESNISERSKHNVNSDLELENFLQSSKLLLSSLIEDLWTDSDGRCGGEEGVEILESCNFLNIHSKDILHIFHNEGGQ